jgi:hypothetical protein
VISAARNSIDIEGMPRSAGVDERSTYLSQSSIGRRTPPLDDYVG